MKRLQVEHCALVEQRGAAVALRELVARLGRTDLLLRIA